jgi:hypothetical protein
MTLPSKNVAEGRASLARPSPRSLLAIAAFLVPVLAAPIAHAEKPRQVVLTDTNPTSKESSRANSTTPRIFGDGDGPITSVIRFGAGGVPIKADVNPSNAVAIYTDSSCTGSAVATGTLGQLENLGIEVKVSADSTTTFYATQTDSAEPSSPSDCSLGLTYWESSTVVTPPSEPPPGGGEPSPGGGKSPLGGEPPTSGNSSAPSAPHLRMSPGGRANDNAPLVTGSAPGATTVKVFNNANCNGTPVAKGSADQLAAGLAVQVADNTTTSFSAISAAGGPPSPCSSPVTYTEDSTAPLTQITMGPGVKTRKRKAVFRFTDASDDPPGTTFLCKVDRHKWAQCSSPLKVRRLGFRRHTVRVKAIDSAGNAEATGAKRRFKVVRGF